MADEDPREELAEATSEAREKQEEEGAREAPPGSEPAAATAADPGELDEGTRALVEELREEGWQWSPLVVHGGSVVGSLSRYQAARFLGMEDQVPTITLEEVYEEAGVDFAQVAGPAEEVDSRREFFEDYLRDLPTHVREKYDLGS